MRVRCAAALVAALLILAAACGGSDNGQQQHAAPTTAATTTAPTSSTVASVFPGKDWAQATPASLGLDKSKLDELAAYLHEKRSHCMAVIKDGRLVYERGWNDFTTSTDQEIFSASKSFTSTLVGIAQDRGYLDINDKASKYITEWKGTPSENVTIKELLSNDSGRYWDLKTDYLKMIGSPDRTKFAIGLSQQYPPETHWVYNNSAIQTLEAVIERSTGQDMEAFAQKYLFGPIGMTSTIIRDKSGNPAAFMGVQASCRDAARFGYLFLEHGTWGKNQVVSKAWAKEATTKSQDLNTAYGYLWWLNSDGGWLGGKDGNTKQTGIWWKGTPLDAYAALGLGDQIILVLPSQNMVVVRLGPSKASETALIGGVSVGKMGQLAVAADEG